MSGFDKLQDEIRDWCGKFNPEIRGQLESTAYHFSNWQRQQDNDLINQVYMEAEQEAFAKIAESYIFWTDYDEKMYTNLRATLCNLSVRDLIEKKTERKYVSWLDGFRPKSRRR